MANYKKEMKLLQNLSYWFLEVNVCSDCLPAIKVSYERDFVAVIGLEDETYRSDTFTNVILSSVIGLVAQKKKVVEKYTHEKIKMLIKDILSDISEAQLYHEENVALPYIAPN